MKRIVGIDVGGTKIAFMLAEYEDEFRIIDRCRIDTEACRGRDFIIENIFNTIDSLLERAGLTGKQLAGIGIALPGPVDINSGISIECPNLDGWTNVAIRKILEERYNTFVFAENDARAAAAGEAGFGAGREFCNFIHISLSTAIGCGIIINNEIYRGADGSAGELSHVIFTGNDELYNIASGKALQDLFSIPAENLKELYEQGNAEAHKAFDHLIYHLGIGIANAITMLNPEAVIIGGGLSNLGDFFLKPLEDEIRKKAFSVSGQNVKILKADNKNEAGVLGISALVIHELGDTVPAAGNIDCQ